jgi:Fic family protein
MESLGFSTQQEALLKALSLDAVKSSEIEGEKLDLTQVRSSIARRLNIHLEKSVRSSRFVDGIVSMILDATQHYAQPLTQERLWQWQIDLLVHTPSMIKLGSWRDDVDGPMEVISGSYGRERVHFRAPDAQLLPIQMEQFLAYANQSEEEPLLKAGILHLWFVTLHPFEDGNGRIARAIADWSLAHSEQNADRYYSMSAQICEERKQYYQILETTQKGSLDISPWLTWFLECLSRGIRKSLDMVDHVLWKKAFFDKHQETPFNARQTLMIEKLMEGFDGKLTAAKWAKITHCSHDTALRDIHKLMEWNILKQEESGGRSTSYRLMTTLV